MRKRAKRSSNPASAKRPRSVEDVDALEGRNFNWKIHKNYIDLEHEEWGWGNTSFREFVTTIVYRLTSYETMAWQEITKRTSCHPMPIQDICERAQTRIRETIMDIDTLHQVDVTELGRVWGFRVRETFYLIWYDPYHTVCPFK